MLEAGRSQVRFPTSLEFSVYLILPVALLALGSTQPLTEMSTRNLPGGKGRPARKADNLTAICELSSKCGSLDVSQHYGPSRPVTGISLLTFTLRKCTYSVTTQMRAFPLLLLLGSIRITSIFL
jgi:hypothetical protein